MIKNATLQALKRAAFQASVRAVPVYGVFDCARDPAIYDMLQRSYRARSCLFAGNLAPELERAAPFLAELSAGDSLTDDLLRRGWDDNWGILLRAEGSFQAVRRHLRTLLRVRMEDGRFMLFRFYDPRVLRSFLPTCAPDQLDSMFGDAILEYLAAGPEPGDPGHRFSWNGVGLQDDPLLDAAAV